MALPEGLVTLAALGAAAMLSAKTAVQTLLPLLGLLPRHPSTPYLLEQMQLVTYFRSLVENN